MATSAASAAGVSGSSGVLPIGSSKVAARVSWESAVTGEPLIVASMPWAISDSTPLSRVGALSPWRRPAASTCLASAMAPMPASTGTAIIG